MSFNVTQCPACESTFNTNSRVLAAASGKVRCGACLNVFEAIDHFLISEEEDAAQNQGESVFVGNDPQEFFDPSSFLTRSALSETHEDEVVDEENLHQQLEKSETVGEDFFVTIAEELQGKAEPTDLEIQIDELEIQNYPTASPQTGTIDEVIDEGFEEEILDSFATAADELAETTQPPTLETSAEEEAPLNFRSENLVPSSADAIVDEEFEEALPADSTPKAADVVELTENNQISSSTEESGEPEPLTIDSEENSTQDKEPFLGTGLSASFTFTPHGSPEVRIGKRGADPQTDSDEQPLITNANDDAELEKESNNPEQSLALESDDQTRNDPVKSPLLGEASFPPSKDEPEEAATAEEAIAESNEQASLETYPITDSDVLDAMDESLSEEEDEAQTVIARFNSLNDELEEAAATEEAITESSEQSSLGPEPITDNEILDDVDESLSREAEQAHLDPAPFQLLNDEPEEAAVTEEAILEPSGESTPAGYPKTDNEALDDSGESLSNEEDEFQILAEQEMANERIAEEEERAKEEKHTKVEEADEESTEAIRARALEAELSDEEALEAIPQENLAALGSMSTPVELLAGKESRLLRSTLLFLTIVLLGGLLSGQYLWQRMELYSQLPQLRPLYELSCSYINCVLPDYTDIDSIRSENLSVQTHPTMSNGLMVTTVIRNTSAFDQPFPILILSFNSVENSVIALREFTSAEYLDPGLRSIQAMPAQTPVQIGLAIMDPGPEAVNYTLAFRWP